MYRKKRSAVKKFKKGQRSEYVHKKGEMINEMLSDEVFNNHPLNVDTDRELEKEEVFDEVLRLASDPRNLMLFMNLKREYMGAYACVIHKMIMNRKKEEPYIELTKINVMVWYSEFIDIINNKEDVRDLIERNPLLRFISGLDILDPIQEDAA